eukprot:4431032-Alexandrium_andersonii.AAC.1
MQPLNRRSMRAMQVPRGRIPTSMHDGKHGLIVFMGIHDMQRANQTAPQRVGGQALLSHGEIHCDQLCLGSGVARVTL